MRFLILILLMIPVFIKNLVYPDSIYLENYSKLYIFGLFIALLIKWMTVIGSYNYDWRKFSQKDLKSFLKERRTSKILKLTCRWIQLLIIISFAIIGEWWIFFLWVLSLPPLVLIEHIQSKIYKEYQASGIEEAEYKELK